MKNIIKISTNFLIRNIYNRSQISRRIFLLFIDILIVFFSVFLLSGFESNLNPVLSSKSYFSLYVFLPFISGFILLLLLFFGSGLFFWLTRSDFSCFDFKIVWHI